jgi:thiol-disulfide isomerase/thioredoxin
MRLFFPTSGRFLAFLAVVALAACGPVPTVTQQEGQPAPAFRLPDLEGNQTTLAQARGEGATLLDFWATWCVPCIFEMPHLQALQNKYRHKGFQVVGVACDSPEDLVPEVIKDQGVTYTNLIGDEEVVKTYAISGYPTLILLDAEGRVFKRFKGSVSGEILDEMIQQVLEVGHAELEPAGDLVEEEEGA